MKDVTFGAAREIPGGKAGMDDKVKVECCSLFHLVRESHSLLSSEFLCTNSGSISISIEFLF